MRKDLIVARFARKLTPPHKTGKGRLAYAAGLFLFLDGSQGVKPFWTDSQVAAVARLSLRRWREMAKECAARPVGRSNGEKVWHVSEVLRTLQRALEEERRERYQERGTTATSQP